MPTIPRFNVLQWVRTALPYKYRLPKMTLLAQNSVYALDWRRGVFDEFCNGASYPLYNPATTYAAGQRVQLLFSTYESLVNGNTGNLPSISPTQWILRCECFIGALERAKYTGRRLQMTYQLNRWFGAQIVAAGLPGFIQPPWPGDVYIAGPSWPSIYITTAVPVFVSPLFGSQPNPYCYFGSRPNLVTWGSEPVIAAASSYKFILHIPVAVYNMLGTNDGVRLSIIDSVVSKYIACGTTYEVETY